MKKSTVFLLFITVFFTKTAFANDLYVRDFGTNGAYATISLAILASADGDRIIIRPKQDAGAYNENLLINKSLTFVSEIDYEKFIIRGNISFVPQINRNINISNMDMKGNMDITTDCPNGGRTYIKFYNSTIQASTFPEYHILFSKKNVSVDMIGCQMSANVYISHGKIIGCSIGYIGLLLDAGDTPATSDVLIIGNKIFNTLTLDTHYQFQVLNNVMTSPSQIGNGILVYNIMPESNNHIDNNSIQNYNHSIFISSGGAQVQGKIYIQNNIIEGIPNNYYEVTNNSNTFKVYINYNISRFNLEISGNSGTYTLGNISNATTLVVDWTNFVFTGANINAGYPVAEFQDTDLTRNDIGHRGGANNFDNYWPSNAANKPQIFLLETPRRVPVNTTTINVSGAGFSK